MRINFVKSSEKRKLLSTLNSEFGITEIPFLLIEAGKEKTRGFSGNMTKEEIQEINEIARIEIIGCYLFKKEKDEIRLGLDGTNIFSQQIDKNIFEISDSNVEKWMKGQDLEIEAEHGLKAVRNAGDFFGCGKSTGERIVNFVPKERRIRRS